MQDNEKRIVMCNIKHKLILLLLEIQPWEKPRVDIVPLDFFFFFLPVGLYSTVFCVFTAQIGFLISLFILFKCHFAWFPCSVATSKAAFQGINFFILFMGYEDFWDPGHRTENGTPLAWPRLPFSFTYLQKPRIKAKSKENGFP